MAESTVRPITDEERDRDRILEALDVRGEALDDDPALMSPTERRQTIAKILYALNRLEVTRNEMMVSLALLGGLTEEEIEAVSEASEDDALHNLGVTGDQELTAGRPT